MTDTYRTFERYLELKLQIKEEIIGKRECCVHLFVCI